MITNKNKFAAAIIIMVLLMISSGIAKAQNAPVTFDIRGGMNLSTYGGDLHDTKTVAKQQFGVGVNFALVDNLYLLTGLDYQTKGSKSTEWGQKIKYNASYLQVPLHVGYKIHLSDKLGISVESGLYAAYGIGGKIKSEDKKVNTFGEGRLKKFDCGVGAAIGFQFYHNFLKVGYDYGLCNISDMSGIKIRNRGLFITSGYVF